MRKREKLELATLWFDGACKGNPGRGGGGWILSTSSTTLGYGWNYIEHCTNNEAEYDGLLKGLEFAATLKNIQFGRLEIKGDSRLVVMQTGGKWKVSAQNLRPLCDQAKRLVSEFDSVKLEWIPRAQNALADALSNLALKNKDTQAFGETELMTLGRLKSLF